MNRKIGAIIFVICAIILYCIMAIATIVGATAVTEMMAIIMLMTTVAFGIIIYLAMEMILDD